MLEVTLRMRTVSTLNAREHWSARAKRAKFERQLAYSTLLGTRAKVPAGHVRVALTRLAAPRGRALDDDNLRGALKAVRDGVADWLGCADNDPRVTWHYVQAKGPQWGVAIQRGTRYGKFVTHARISQSLKRVIADQLEARPLLLTADQQEALEMICHKIARIINGDPDYSDSWADIAGYAQLVADRLKGVER